MNGKVYIDFKDPEAIRILTKCLLIKDFGLTVTLPSNNLVPALPLRLNYLHWLSDIFEHLKFENVVGIDIGCGASCIYPLLANKLKSWKMFALETNEESVKSANENVKQNQLASFITIIKQNSDEIFSNQIFKDTDSVDFCMCNPPFFDTQMDLKYEPKKNRTGGRKSPTSFRTGCSTELEVEGGEEAFIKQIIEKSCSLKNAIRVYTTMVGHQRNVAPIINFLTSKGITNYIQTEFCQGQTTRWGIAWAFGYETLLRKVPDLNLMNRCRNTTITKEFLFDDERFVLVKVKGILEKIHILCSVNEKGLEITAFKNTWSNQRKRKREMLKNPEILEERVDEPNTDPVLIAEISMEKKYEKKFDLCIKYLYGSVGKNGIHQIMQHIVNSWLEN